MSHPVDLVEIWRGGLLESVHQGHAVICDDTGQIVQSWGDPSAIIFPRSSCKMIQALPLIESGAAAAYGLTAQQLALSCASHQGATIHTDPVSDWLETLDLTDDALRCGPQMPSDAHARDALIRAHGKPCQVHNNCSGKHAGFLTLNKHLGGASDYELVDHPVQQACKAAFEDVTQETNAGYGIDGCSAPNFATSLHGFAKGLAFFAGAHDRSDTRSKAAAQLVQAMAAFPELVAGETRACTDLMRAMDHKVALKTGAEAVFAAIIPEKRMSIALKITDGATRASECAIAAILVKLGVLDAAHPATIKRMTPALKNWRGTVTGFIRPSAALT